MWFVDVIQSQAWRSWREIALLSWPLEEVPTEGALVAVEGPVDDHALVLEEVLGTSADMWVRMQAEYDLWDARQKAA